MKRFLFALLLVLAITSISAQTYKKQADGTLVKVETTNKNKVEKTQMIVTIKDVEYPVYKSAKGKYFIIRTSKKTGNEYKQYITIE